MLSRFTRRTAMAVAVGSVSLLLGASGAALAQPQPAPDGGPISVAAPRGPVVARGTVSFGLRGPFELPILRFVHATGASFTRVPVSRRLVVEQVSLRAETGDQGDDTPRFLSATLTSDVASASGDLVRWQHFVSAALAGVFSGRAQFPSATPVRYYAFEGERLSLRVQLDRPTPDGAKASYTVTGVLE